MEAAIKTFFSAKNFAVVGASTVSIIFFFVGNEKITSFYSYFLYYKQLKMSLLFGCYRILLNMATRVKNSSLLWNRRYTRISNTCPLCCNRLRIKCVDEYLCLRNERCDREKERRKHQEMIKQAKRHKRVLT